MTARGILKGKDNPKYKTGDCMNGKRSHLYCAWQNMKQRCVNKNGRKWYRYGGRGITFCESWQEFKTFKEWALNNGYKKGLTLDRIDNNGNYEPSNCQWLPLVENSIKRSNVKLNPKKAREIRSKLYAYCKTLGEEYGCSADTIWSISHNRVWKPRRK